MFRVELHDKANGLVGILSGATKAACHPVLNSDGSGLFQIHRSDPDVARLGILTGGIDRYIVHLLRKGQFEAAFTDRFSFRVESVAGGIDDQEEQSAWITVAGRGTLCLLEDRMAFPPGYDGVNQSSVTGQWQIYTATPGGQIMGGEINRSNGRFAIPLTHSVDTSTVPQSTPLRFDNLRKLHDYLVGNGMDAQMVGLDYQAADNLGTDKSATVTVRLSQQDSLRALALQRDSRPVKNYAVAQGTGEGINALLRSSSDATSIAAYGRSEGFIDASQDSDATQLALRASSAVKQLKNPDQRITVRFIDSQTTQLYRDLSLGDTIKLDGSPLPVLASYRVVGFSIADTDADLEEISLDLNSMRQEYLLKLATGAQLNADQLNTIATHPQGGPYNDSFGFADSADATYPWRIKRFVPSNILQLNYCKLSFFLDAFRSPVAGANTVTSGASSAASSSSGAGDHTHTVGITGGGGNPPFDPIGYNIAGGFGAGGMQKNSAGATSTQTSTADTGVNHSHLIAHTHNVTPTLIYGIFLGTTATNVKVIINGTDRTVALGGAAGGFTTDQTELELKQWINLGAVNTFELQPSNLGRIHGDVRMTGYIQSN